MELTSWKEGAEAQLEERKAEHGACPSGGTSGLHALHLGCSQCVAGGATGRPCRCRGI